MNLQECRRVKAGMIVFQKPSTGIVSKKGRSLQCHQMLWRVNSVRSRLGIDN